MSQIDINPYWNQFEPVSKKWYYTFAFVCFLIDFLGILTNLLVLYYLIKKRSKRSSNGKIFIINLALTDMLNLTINIPLKTISNFNQRWIFGKTVCEMFGFLGGLFGFVSITTMALMSIERFLIVKNPLNALKLNEKFMLGCSAFSWIYSLLCISLSFFTKRGFDLEGILTSCTIDYISQDSVSRLVLILMFIGGFILPFSIIVICYYLIISILKLKNNILQYNFSSNNHHVYKFSKKSLNLSGSEHFRSVSSLSINENSRFVMNKIENPHYDQAHEVFELNSKYYTHSMNIDLKNNFFFKREIRVSKTILTFVGFFCLTWFPYAIVLLVAQFASNREYFITPLSASLPALFAKFSTVANPIIYTLHYKECKLFFLDVFHLRKIFFKYSKHKQKI